MSKALFRGKPVNPIDLDALPEYHKWVKDGWIYGYLIGKDVIVGEIVYFENDFFATEFWCRVKPETVGWCTGMCDKNNVKIFTEDIIEWQDSYWLECGLEDGRGYICKGVVRYKSEKGYYILVDSNEQYIDLLGRVELPVRIGNIYDNPELLRSEADA